MSSKFRSHSSQDVRNQSRFANIPSTDIQRSVFDRSCGVRTTFDGGLLVPCFWDEVLPGDTLTMNVRSFIRLETLLRPLMENIYVDFHFFYAPYRILWDHWINFMGEKDNPDDTTTYSVPKMTSPNSGPINIGYLCRTNFCYLGLPTQVPDMEHSSLPLRAINRIYKDWFKDQNLIDDPPINTGDTDDDFADYMSGTGPGGLFRRGKRHDYYTASLPFAQKGDPVELPLGTTAPIVPSGDETPSFNMSGQSAGALQVSSGIQQSSEFLTVFGGNASTGGPHNLTWDQPKLEADLTSATAATINSIREAFQLQRMYERDARGGTRYTEVLRSHFGVISPDARLQRTEYLGGGSTPIMVHPVAATNNGNSVDTGDLGGYGTAVWDGRAFNKSFTEHGIIIGFISTRTDLTYQQGLDRFWSRKSRFDFYWPTLAHLGEQAVYNKEIYFANEAADDDVFGYQERYAEYRYKRSELTGNMRSNASWESGAAGDRSVDFWHLGQDFSTRPLLNQSFIEETPPFDRVLAVTPETGDNQFLADLWFEYRSVRPMPTYGVPGYLDHF